MKGTARTAAAVAAAGLMAAGCGNANVTASGTVTVSDAGSYGVAGDDAGCTGPQGAGGLQMVTEGTQVTIRAPGGAVIGTGMLGKPAAGSVPGQQCVFPFSVTGLPKEPRYGVQMTGKGTAWFSPSQIHRARAYLGDGTSERASVLQRH